MLDQATFKKAFGDWWPHIEPAFPLLEPIYAKLKERAKQGAKIFPNSTDTFRAFTETKYKDVRMVWMGQCPYHTTIKGNPIADGLCFSCNGEEESPSLRVLYNAIEDDIGEIFLERPLKLDYLANQGVLMLNASLTTENGVADSHNELWAPFMEYICREIFERFRGMPIIAFGTPARRLLHPHMTYDHLYKHVFHPAYYARRKEPMAHEGIFSWANDCIERNNGDIYRIEYNYKNLLTF